MPELADAAAATHGWKSVKGKFVLISRTGAHVPRAAGTRAERARGDDHEPQRPARRGAPRLRTTYAALAPAGVATTQRACHHRASRFRRRDRHRYDELVQRLGRQQDLRRRIGQACRRSTCPARTTGCCIASRPTIRDRACALPSRHSRRPRKSRCSTSSPRSRAPNLPNEYVLLSAHLDSWLARPARRTTAPAR